MANKDLPTYLIDKQGRLKSCPACGKQVLIGKIPLETTMSLVYLYISDGYTLHLEIQRRDTT